MIALSFDPQVHAGDLIALVGWVVGFLILLFKIFIPMRDTMRDTSLGLLELRKEVNRQASDIRKHDRMIAEMKGAERARAT